MQQLGGEHEPTTTLFVASGPAHGHAHTPRAGGRQILAAHCIYPRYCRRLVAYHSTGPADIERFHRPGGCDSRFYPVDHRTHGVPSDAGIGSGSFHGPGLRLQMSGTTHVSRSWPDIRVAIVAFGGGGDRERRFAVSQA